MNPQPGQTLIKMCIRDRAFYSRATTDIEYAFPFTDWGELWGIADRTNYDPVSYTHLDVYKRQDLTTDGPLFARKAGPG